ncbi:MAG TPA: efflux RND transporter periplasmic adaptor subunit [Thermoanaerobaculia bacterium]|nr:efflux RND transporter periplasmic adaptor subunit [Thermoanaerobaculia bacterium]
MKRELASGLGLVLGVLGILCGLCGAAAGCHKSQAEKPPPPPAVVVAPVVQRDVPVYGEWIGTTAGDVNAEIRPKVEGYLLRRVYAEGSFVRQGAPLFVIDPRQFQAQLAQAEANLGQVQASLAKAERDVARFRPLAAEKALSQQELDNAVSAEQVAKANVAALRAAVSQARLNLQWTKVTSPIAGIAGAAERQVGDLVSPQTVLVTVSRVDPLRVLFNISEQELMRYEQRAGAPGASFGELDLVLADGTVFPRKGKMIFADRQVNVKTGTIGVVGLFPNPGNLLRPGQYAKVRAMTSLKRGALLVPQRAVNEMQGSYQVAVVGPDDRAEVRTVQPGERVEGLWVIDAGLRPGDRVVTDGFSRVKSGAPVTPETAPQAAPPEAPPAAGAPPSPSTARPAAPPGS